MIELIVEDLEGKRVATVSQNPQNSYDISTDDQVVKETISHIIETSGKTGIPLRYNRRQRIQQGMTFLRLAQWIKPGDNYYLHALAEELVKHKLYAYTVDRSVAPNTSCISKN